jgi:hypothetical protein
MPRQQRNLKELIEITWQEIDRCLKKLDDKEVRDKHKILWSQNLASFVSRLDKMLTKAGLGKLDEESLSKMLEKVPKRYREIILKRVFSKRAKERPIQEA